MTSPDSPIAGLTSALAAHGFVHLGPGKDGWLTFTGSLTAEGAAHPILLAVHPEGRELPLVALENVPDKLRPVAPHLGSNGVLCYAAAGSVVRMYSISPARLWLALTAPRRFSAACCAAR